MKKFKYLKTKEINKLPKGPGIYAFKQGGRFLYIGKAANLYARAKQHKDLLRQTKQVGYIKTNSEIKALILEANLIKKEQPKYNVIWRDDKNYFFVGLTKEDFPRIFWSHQTKLKTQPRLAELGGVEPRPFTKGRGEIDYVGPFVDGRVLKQTLKVLRKVFPHRSCYKIPNRPCLWYHLNRCPAPCLLKILSRGQTLGQNFGVRMKRECQRNAKNLMKILKEGKNKVLAELKKEMNWASKNQDFETAGKIRDQISALEKVLAHAKIFNVADFDVADVKWRQFRSWDELQKILQKILKTKKSISRIEAYDVSNIQGEQATGSMVTFVNGLPDKNFYRKFKIKIVGKPNDIAMIKEVLTRRFKHPEWPFPDLILIDGGKAQLNAALKIINRHKSAKSALINVLALAKKRNELFIEGRKNPILLKNLPREIFNLILQLRDEAHRFARKYHLKLREIDFFPKS